MIKIVLSAMAALAVTATPSLGAETAKPAATTAEAKTAKFTTADTEIGTLLDNPATKAILDKYIPGLTTNEQIEMARGMTLKGIQAYAADTVTDDKLAKIDAELAKLPR